MRLILFGTTLIFVLTGFALGQSGYRNDALEQEIRKLDMAEADAVLRGDLPALEKIWLEEYTVNAPNSQVANGRAEVLKIFRAGIASYSSFVREIESVVFHKNTAIVMGLETVKPIGNAPLAGQTVRRRFTNIWMKNKGKWHMAARHANVICKN